MKRFLSFILCLTLVLPLIGCGGAKEPGNTAAQAFSVGYGKADISPENPVPLSGYGDELERISTVVSQPLYVTCTAFQDTRHRLIECAVTATADHQVHLPCPVTNHLISIALAFGDIDNDIVIRPIKHGNNIRKQFVGLPGAGIGIEHKKQFLHSLTCFSVR